MHWFNRMIRLAELAGEWWVIDGDAAFADGDTGDINHEGMVADHVRRQYADDRFDRGEYVDWDAFEASLLAERIAGGRLDAGTMDSKAKDQLVREALAELGMTPEEIAIARNSSNIDARDWGLEHLGWKRVKDRYVDTWNLEARDLAAIARGLGNAYESVEDESELVFDINVVSTRTLYEDVPFAVIESNTPDELLPYRRSY